MLTGLFKDASFSPLLNLHVYFLLVGVFRFGQCLGWRFSPMYIFFFLVWFRAISNAAHFRFWCRDPKLYFPGFFKVLVLALP